MKAWKLICAVLILAAAGCGSEEDPLDAAMPKPPPLRVHVMTPKDDAARLERAYLALIAACPQIVWNAERVTEVRGTVSAGGEYDYRTVRYGWRNYYSFSIEGNWPAGGTASDSPSAPPGGEMTGHTLFFHLGIGEKPGLLAKKRWSQWFCGLPVSEDGSDVFVPHPEFIDAEAELNNSAS